MRGKNSFNKTRTVSGVHRKIAPAKNPMPKLDFSKKTQERLGKFNEQLREDFLVICDLDLSVGEYEIDPRECGKNIDRHLIEGDYLFTSAKLIVEDVKKSFFSKKVHRKYTFNFKDVPLMGYDETNRKRTSYRAKEYEFVIELPEYSSSDNHDHDVYKISNSHQGMQAPKGVDFRPDNRSNPTPLVWEIENKSWRIPWDSTRPFYFKEDTNDQGRPQISTMLAANASRGEHLLFIAGLRGAIMAWAKHQTQVENAKKSVKSHTRKSPLRP